MATDQSVGRQAAGQLIRTTYRSEGAVEKIGSGSENGRRAPGKKKELRRWQVDARRGRVREKDTPHGLGSGTDFIAQRELPPKQAAEEAILMALLRLAVMKLPMERRFSRDDPSREKEQGQKTRNDRTGCPPHSGLAVSQVQSESNKAIPKPECKQFVAPLSHLASASRLGRSGTTVWTESAYRS